MRIPQPIQSLCSAVLIVAALPTCSARAEITRPIRSNSSRDAIKEQQRLRLEQHHARRQQQVSHKIRHDMMEVHHSEQVATDP
jgi:hypothetical protein